MKIYLKGYTNGNLGDDLFINIIAQRYSKDDFYIFNTGCFKYKNTFANNVKVTGGFFSKVLNKAIKFFTFKKRSYDYILQKRHDLTVVIGGSMFMERNNEKLGEKYVRGDRSYYILGCNFGPYKTQRYFEKYYTIFKNAQDVCFRESYSKLLFENLPNVRNAPDIVFALDKSKIKVTTNKRVIFSVIDYSKRYDVHVKKIYICKIIELSVFFINKGYDILFMSFCKNEGDEYAIKEIIENMDNVIAEKITVYHYNGNTAEALNVIGDSQIVVGTRLHSNILGMLLGKTIIPIAYSKKTINVLEDMNFKGRVIDTNKLEHFDTNTLTDDDLSYIHDVSSETIDAFKHFEKLDKLLMKDEK